MSPIRSRSLRTAAVSAAAAALVTVMTSPAHAIVTPLWPEAGYTPKCDSVEAGPGGTLYALGYTDETLPSMGPVTFGKGKTTMVVGKDGAAFRFQARMKDSCSGVAGASVFAVHDGVLSPGPLPLVPDVDDGMYFDVYAVATGLNAQADDAGVWTFPLAQVYDRYEFFVLDQDHKWLGSEVDRSAPAWREPSGSVLILRETRTVASASDTSVRAGAKVTLKVMVDVAGMGVWDDLSGEKVVLQSKSGSGKWRTAARLTTGSSGTAGTKVKPRTTTSYRVVLAADKSVGYYAGSSSRSVTVTVR